MIEKIDGLKINYLSNLVTHVTQFNVVMSLLVLIRSIRK